MFIAVLSLIAKMWMQPWCLLMRDWISKVVYPYTGLLLTLKWEGISAAAAIGMSLKDIMLGDLSTA